MTFTTVGGITNVFEHESSSTGGIPLWIYHVSQLLHHTLHHLRFVLQQLRRELFVQPSLEEEKTPVTPKALNTLLSLSKQAAVLMSTHLFQFSDQLRRSHHILLTVILVDVAFVIKQSVWHFTEIFLKPTLTRRNRLARFQHKSFIPATRALLAILGVVFFPPLFGLHGRSNLRTLFYYFVPTIHKRYWFPCAIVISFIFNSWLCSLVAEFTTCINVMPWNIGSCKNNLRDNKTLFSHQLVTQAHVIK